MKRQKYHWRRRDSHFDPREVLTISLKIPARKFKERIERESALAMALTILYKSRASHALLRGVRFRGSGNEIEDWDAGGCHLWALAFARWVNGSDPLDRRALRLRDRRSQKVIRPVGQLFILYERKCVHIGRTHMIHVLVRVRGKYYDSTGVRTRSQLTDGGRLQLVPYLPDEWRFEDVPRDTRAKTALYKLFCTVLHDPAQWFGEEVQTFARTRGRRKPRLLGRLLEFDPEGRREQWTFTGSRPVFRLPGRRVRRSRRR